MILVDFGCKMEASWHPKSNKIEPNFERRFFEKQKNLVFHKEKQRFWRFRVSTMGVKIIKKPMKKEGHPGKASWHQFFMDFIRLLLAQGEAKSTQERPKKALGKG